MIEFEITPQGGGGVAVTKYREHGRHVGAVARMEYDKVLVLKPISLEGLAKIVEALRPHTRPEPAPLAQSQPPPAEAALDLEPLIPDP